MLLFFTVDGKKSLVFFPTRKSDVFFGIIFQRNSSHKINGGKVGGCMFETRQMKWKSQDSMVCCCSKKSEDTPPHQKFRKQTDVSWGCTLFPIIMEVENGCIWRVTTVGGTHFSLQWLFLHHWWPICKFANQCSTFGMESSPAFLTGWFFCHSTKTVYPNNPGR